MSGSGEAGILLAQAWRELYGMDPDPSEAYRHAVRAIEPQPRRLCTRTVP